MKRDFEMAQTLLNENGTIAFHDALSWPDVKRFISDLKTKGVPINVKGQLLYQIVEPLKRLYESVLKLTSPSRSKQDGGGVVEKTIALYSNQKKGSLLNFPRRYLYDLWFDGIAVYKKTPSRPE